MSRISRQARRGRCVESVQLVLPITGIAPGSKEVHLIAKLRGMADTMQKHIDDKMRPMTQNPTPKRLSEYASRRHDGANMQRAQAAMRAMADHLEAGTLPPILEDVAKSTKRNIMALVRTRWRSGGWNDAGGDSGEFADDTPEGKALQALITGVGPSKAELEQERLEQKVRLLVGQIPGFFPTPRPIVDQLLDAAYLYPAGLTILEPSAGSGAIADVVREKHPEHTLDVCERNYTLRELLEIKGHSLVGNDCLELEGKWNRVIMNPPFENRRDVRHIEHLYDNCLAAGGILVSVLPGSGNGYGLYEWVEKRFGNWLDDKDWDTLSFPPDAFKESGTSVSTCGLVLRKRGK
jgi:hypothetical protein